MSILYCPVCGGAQFGIKTNSEGSIMWIVCLSCGMDSDIDNGFIEEWGPKL